MKNGFMRAPRCCAPACGARNDLFVLRFTARLRSPRLATLISGKTLAQELQTEINDETLETVSSIETDDINRFGRIRDPRDKELRDLDDVFIHAEERRKQLAKQSKKR